jgi:hypothetical protein
MPLGPVIVQRSIGSRAGAARDGAIGERQRFGRVPLLRRRARGDHQREQAERGRTHAGQAIRRHLGAATIAALAACGGNGAGPGVGVARADLLALAREDSAEPSPRAFAFKNNLLANFSFTHSDSVHTILATFTFTPRSIVSRNDTLVCDTCTVTVTVEVTPLTYELTVGPPGLVFNASGEPVLAVSYGRYGDSSVYTMSSRYASATQFAQALGLWHERSTDVWVESRNSAHTGSSTVTGALEGPGRVLLAAPK